MRNILIIFILFFIISCNTIKDIEINNKNIAIKGFPLEMALVEKGKFKMGSFDGYIEERPIHTVEIGKSFFMSKYEITNYQAAKVFSYGFLKGKIIVTEKGVIINNEHKNKLIDIFDNDSQIYFNNGSFTVKPGKENHPLVEISWYGAVMFCNLLSEIEGLTPSYDLNNWNCDWELNSYRLPTEAEWEFASSGGINTKYYLYSGSNDADFVGWFDKNSFNTSHEVGQKLPNELGLYDMSGNVWEWCNDWFKPRYYFKSPSIDPKGPDDGVTKALRGGSWFLDVFNTRSTGRFLSCYPNASGNHGGFRVILPTSMIIVEK